jgi:membrane associated rhomboid family serine protease
MQREGATPEARAVSYRLRSAFLFVFAVAGFFYGLCDPFLGFDWPEPALRITSAAIGFAGGAVLGWVLCYVAPRTP